MDNAVADLASGPVIFWTIFSMNFLEYGMGSRPFAPPEIVDQIMRQLSWHRGVVPGGEFDMGLTEDDIAAAREHFDWTPDFASHFEATISDLRPVHRVRVRPFLVTRALLSHEDVERLSEGRFEGIHCYSLRRQEARELARSLGLRLCSEAEIEWLARDGGRFHFTLDAARKLEEIGGDSSLLRSRFGVEELFEEQWAEDDYHPTYEGAPTTSAPWMDGDACGVARGGPMPEYVDELEQLIGLLASLRSNQTQQKARVRLARDLPG